jgi:hypothetical protein
MFPFQWEAKSKKEKPFSERFTLDEIHPRLNSSWQNYPEPVTMNTRRNYSMKRTSSTNSYTRLYTILLMTRSPLSGIMSVKRLTTADWNMKSALRHMVRILTD